MAALVAVAQREPTFFTEHSETAFKEKDTTSYPATGEEDGGTGGVFRYPTILERYKVMPLGQSLFNIELIRSETRG